MAGELYRKISHVGDQTIPRGWRQVIPTPSVKEFRTSGLQVRAQRMPPSAGSMEGTRMARRMFAVENVVELLKT